MTVTDRTDATDAEFRSRIAAFESAPTPPEIVEARVVEEVARALTDPMPEWRGGPDADYWRMRAAAAVAAYRAAQDGGAEEAVRPHKSGDVTVIGPECFASADETVICWRGQNFYTAEGKYAADCAALAPQADR